MVFVLPLCSWSAAGTRRAPADYVGGGGSAAGEALELRPHLSGIGTFPTPRERDVGGCRGFIGPVPPPLWMCPAMWSGSVHARPVRTSAGTLCARSNPEMPPMTDEPRSPHAEPPEAPHPAA